MTRRTAKVGIAGKYGTRYGVRVRKRMRDVGTQRADTYPCPRCMSVAVRRTSAGIWECRHCDLVFTGGAYQPVVSKGIVREVPGGEEGKEKDRKPEKKKEG